MKIAMQEKDALKKNVVTMVRAAIKQYEVDNRVELDDNGVTDIIVKEVKKRRDSLPEYEKSGRQELIDQLNYELNYLSKYLQAAIAATAPSAVAVVIWRMRFERQSPATKMAGSRVRQSSPASK